MKKAVIFGAGNIGRGFIGALLSQGGYHVTFIDVSKPVVERINQDHAYPLRIVDGDTVEEIIVENVSAIDGNDREAAPRAVADADIAATCVGAKAIKYILPNFVDGVKLRHAEGKGPLNLLICENLMDADKYIHSLLQDMLTEEELNEVGLIETSVGRMVPVPKPETTLDNPLRICVERYGVLPVDKDAFKGEVPEIKNVVPFSPFHYYIERKLYLHNMGHAISAYLGDYLGHEYIYQSIAVPEVRVIVKEAMLESALALAEKYSVPVKPLTDHAADLIRRFGNKALGDTCARVGADIPRKLAASDRLIGAAGNVASVGHCPVFICLGAAAALWDYVKQNPGTDAEEAFLSLSGLSAEDAVTRRALALYELFDAGKSLGEILAAADALAKNTIGMIV